MVVGALPNMKIQLDPDDILIGYTDGVTDPCSPAREFFSSKSLQQILEQQSNHDNSAADILKCIENNLFAHINEASQFDYITMLAIRRLKA